MLAFSNASVTTTVPPQPPSLDMLPDNCLFPSVTQQRSPALETPAPDQRNAGEEEEEGVAGVAVPNKRNLFGSR